MPQSPPLWVTHDGPRTANPLKLVPYISRDIFLESVALTAVCHTYRNRL
jgi:hypothetical protein